MLLSFSLSLSLFGKVMMACGAVRSTQNDLTNSCGSSSSSCCASLVVKDMIILSFGDFISYQGVSSVDESTFELLL